MRREWIEIDFLPPNHPQKESPSMRREWIEIRLLRLIRREKLMSPSMRREWIEMQLVYSCRRWFCVSLHAEGVD